MQLVPLIRGLIYPISRTFLRFSRINALFPDFSDLKILSFKIQWLSFWSVQILNIKLVNSNMSRSRQSMSSFVQKKT